MRSDFDFGKDRIRQSLLIEDIGLIGMSPSDQTAA